MIPWFYESIKWLPGRKQREGGQQEIISVNRRSSENWKGELAMLMHTLQGDIGIAAET